MTSRATAAVLMCLVLQAVGALVLGGRCPRADAKEKKPAEPARHVVLVLLGGGVRSADMTDAKLMPTVAAMAEGGRRIGKIASGARDGYTAAARILTGRDDGLDGASALRPPHPTVCEVVRRALDLPREKVWFVSYEGEDHLHLAHSLHAEYGAVLGPAVAHGQGAFAQPLRGLLEKLGRPLPLEDDAWPQLRRLRLLNRNAVAAWLPRSVDAGLPRAEAVERALLREIDRRALLVEGPNPKDELALRAARTVLEIHRPVLTVVRLGEAEQAEASYDRYRAVLRAGDAGIGRLRKAVAGDPLMAGKTSFVVVADRGRNETPDASGTLRADDRSRQRGRVVLVSEGPGWRRKPAGKGARRLEDVAPTIAALLGVTMPSAQGRAWSEWLQPR